MGIKGLNKGADQARENNSPHLNWSWKGERSEVVKFMHDGISGNDKLARAVIDASDVQYGFFKKFDNNALNRLRRQYSREEHERLVLERRLLELRNLNLCIDDLVADFPDLVDIIVVYDSLKYRREAKKQTLQQRQHEVIKPEIKSRTQTAVKEYRYSKRKGEKPSVPQLEFDVKEGWFSFAAFSPPTDEELESPTDVSDTERSIHEEALRLAKRSTQIVSTTEADSICREASRGTYRDHDMNPDSHFPVDHFRLALEPPPPSATWTIHDLSIIVGNDSDHCLLNDHHTARFVVGFAHSYDCRATDLLKRFKHPSDWKFKNRYAQTLAGALLGCDESPGVPGYTIPGVARATRPLEPNKKPSIRLQNERRILAFVNEYDELAGMWLNTISNQRFETSLLSNTERSVSRKEFEQDFDHFQLSLLGSTHETPPMTLSTLINVFHGLLTSDGARIEKEDVKRLAQQSASDSLNRLLTSIYKDPAPRNHPFSSLVPKSTVPLPLPTTSTQPKQHRPFALRTGPDSRDFFDQQLKESTTLRNRQLNASESTTTGQQKKKGVGKQKRGKGNEGQEGDGNEDDRDPGDDEGDDEDDGEDDEDDGEDDDGQGKKTRAAKIGNGLKEYNFSMSTLSFPFKTSHINQLDFPAIPKGHKFNYDFIAVLEGMLKVWLAECPAILETVSALVTVYWEFAPCLVVQLASNAQKFGDRVGALVVSLARYYDAFPLSDPVLPTLSKTDISAALWLTPFIAEFERNVPVEKQAAFHRRVVESGLTEGEFAVMCGKVDEDGNIKPGEIDLAIALVIRERRQLQFPPPLLRTVQLIALNFTTCGTGFMNATDSRSKRIPSFIANNLLTTFLQFPKRVSGNPHRLSTTRLSDALDQLAQFDPSIIGQLLPSMTSKKLVRLVKLRIQTTLLPQTTEAAPPPSPSAVEKEPDQNEDGDEPRQDDVGEEPLRDDDGDLIMLSSEGDDENQEEDAQSDYGDEDEEPADKEESDDSAIPKLFKARFRQELLRTVSGKPTPISSSDLYPIVNSLVDLFVASLDFALDYLRQSYLEAIKDLSKLGRKRMKELKTIGDLVRAIGGDTIEVKKHGEKFFEAEGGGSNGERRTEEQEEEEAIRQSRVEDDSPAPKLSDSQKVLKRMVVDFLPLVGKPFLSFTNKSGREKKNHLPTLIIALLARTAVNAESFNANLKRQYPNFKVEPFSIPTELEVSKLDVNDPARHALETFIRLSSSKGDRFIRQQMKYPNKILSWTNDSWTGLDLEEVDSDGPLLVRRPTPQTLNRLEDQSNTVHAMFDRLGVSGKDSKDIESEILSKIFKPSIGHRLYHGNFWFDANNIRSLVFDPRYFRPAGAKKFGGKSHILFLKLEPSEKFTHASSFGELEAVKDMGWREGVEELISTHPRVIPVYEKMEKKRNELRKAKGDPEVELLQVVSNSKSLIEYEEGTPRRSNQPKFEEKKEIRNLPLLFETRQLSVPASTDEERSNTTVTKLRYRQPFRTSEPSCLDPRQGLFLPFKSELSETGKKTMGIWSGFISETFYGEKPPSTSPSEQTSTTSLQQTTDHSSPRQQPHSTSPPLVPPRSLESSSTDAANVATTSSSTSKVEHRQTPNAPSSFEVPSPSISVPHTASSATIDEPLNAVATRAVSTLSSAVQPPVPTRTRRMQGGGATSGTVGEIKLTKTSLEDEDERPKRGHIFAVDEGRVQLLVGALFSNDGGKVKIVRVSSGDSIKRDKRYQVRLKTLLPFESRSRFAHALQVETKVESTQLSVLLQRARAVDPKNPFRNLPLERIAFESSTFILPPPLQPGWIHTPDWIRTIIVNNHRTSETKRLTSEARKRWEKLVPNPGDGTVIPVAYVLPYGNISGGRGYGRQASQGVVDADLRALKAMKWIRLILVRSTEWYTSKVCSKPGCGASLIYPCRLTDLSDILRLVVCLKCFRVSHRDDNAAINTARIAIARGQNVEGNLLSPRNARLLNYRFRAENKDVARLKRNLNKILAPLSEEERIKKLENLREADSLLDIIKKLAGTEEVEGGETAEIIDAEEVEGSYGSRNVEEDSEGSQEMDSEEEED
ncbi:uncharacterized protein JCM6883_005949 [Sporobolomyces salmoneus]|uniref:uncharacterized protein n=1 Tax=Sporobolomyces salmoneus TaxID=183962 RepID=UPI00316E550E